MGNKGRNNTKRHKRNKTSRASKLAWRIRKGQMCNSDYQTRFEGGDLFEDLCNKNYGDNLCTDQSTSTFVTDASDTASENDDATKISSCEVESEMPISEVQYQIMRNSEWCSKTYAPRLKKTQSFQLGGIISSPEYEKIMDTPLQVERLPKTPSIISGNRIVELGYMLDWAINLQYNHSKTCTSGKLFVHQEVRTNKGLSSSIIFKCTQCDAIIQHETENPNKISEINSGAVWGTMATGSTFGHLEELLSCINIPCMPDNMFYDFEKVIGDEWKKSLWRSMEAAGIKERNNALEKGQICEDGMPWITVYVDGSWSKRSYGTNYNALSGMVGIIGRYTREVLYIAVRNKFCSICARAENKDSNAKQHKCYKNWDESAPSMESDMVVQGFSESEEVHNVRYLQFIADGDSSVFSKIKQKVSYGSDVRKIECSNHALKNYGKHLRRIKSDTTVSLEGRKMLTLKKILALTKRAKCSIYEHGKSENPDINLFREDLRLGLHHVFDDHTACREGTCNDRGNQSNNQIPTLKSTFIYNHLQGALNLLLRKAHLLISNENNNTAERLMNIVSRFNMGKRINLIQRGSYERRVYLSGLRFNKTFNWHYSPWKSYTGNSPGHHFSKYIEKQVAKKSLKARKRLFSDGETDHIPKKKQKKDKLVKNTDYGDLAETPPETEEDLEFIISESKLIIESLQISKDKIKLIQKQSVGQFGNKLYESERKLRLTASLFGNIMNRRPYTPCHSFVKACLKPCIFSTDATEYGIAKENVAILQLERTLNITVERSGLWIDEHYGFLGASPDGLVGSDAIVEVKCIYAPNKEADSIENLLPQLKNPFLIKDRNGISLKRRHKYYYQIQGQLNITKRSKCYFVVYVTDKIPIYVETIYRDESLWSTSMVPTLCKFYEECVAREIVRGNLNKNKICLDPPYIRDAIAAHEANKRNNHLQRNALPSRS